MEVVWKILVWLYIIVFIALFLSATVHHHFGLRRKYINFLLRLFAFGQERVEHRRQKSRELPKGVDNGKETVNASAENFSAGSSAEDVDTDAENVNSDAKNENIDAKNANTDGENVSTSADNFGIDDCTENVNTSGENEKCSSENLNTCAEDVNADISAESVDTSWGVNSDLAISLEHPHALGIHKDIRGFHLDNVLGYITAGMAAVMEDNVTKYFEPEELPMWNLLSRTNNRAYEFVSFRLTVCWVVGFLVRYILLFPLRVIILAFGIVLFWSAMLFVGLFPDGPLKRWLNKKLVVFCFDFVAGSLSLVATFHNTENAPESGIAVANHTSPIDSLVLATHNCYDMVGQKHGGFLGFIMKGLSHASAHIWFERSEAKDRSLVVKRLKEHADNPDLPPILIFPEGVCVNNTSVMQFKKGAFEIASVVHPIAIRFDVRFGDAFWWQDKFLHYVLCMMTSWAIVCNVWYLPPMTRLPTESAIAFANRVKAKIAREGGMIDLSWDGFLKAQPVKQEWLKQQQQEFAKHLQPQCKEKEE